MHHSLMSPYIAWVRILGTIINHIRSPWTSNEVARVDVVVVELVVQLTVAI